MIFFCDNKDEEWINEHVRILQETYEVINVECGDKFRLIGMYLKMDRQNREVILMQLKFVQSAVDAFGVIKTVPSPAFMI
jgi:hypothetical protein